MSDILTDLLEHRPDYTHHDISNEEWREYEYTDGHIMRISFPKTLVVKTKDAGDSHRVVDSYDIVHYMPSGWRTIRWFGKDGKLAMDF